MRKLLDFLKLSWPAATAAPRAFGPKPRELMTDSDWVRHRAPERHRDEELSDAALTWLVRMPSELRPDVLCVRFPRIVNRLAVLWRDPGLTEHYLDELLQPPRPGRLGFPADVAAELQALLACNELRP